MSEGAAATARDVGDGERKALMGRARIVGLGTLASRVLGFVRDQAIAALFNTDARDAWFNAFLIPNSLRAILAEGGVSSAVVPILTEVRAREGEEAAQIFFAKVRGLSLTALVIASAVGAIGAPWIIDHYLPGLHARPAVFDLTVSLTRVVFPFLFFMGTAALGMAALNTHRRFLVPAFAPGLLNVGLLLAMGVLPGPLARAGIDPTFALAIGALAGGAMQVAMQMPALRAIGYLDRPRSWFGDPRVRKLVKRLAPLLLGQGIYYVDLIVCRGLLADSVPGAASWFVLAQRVCDFPQGIFVMALQAATIPSLASLALLEDKRELGRTFAYALRLSLFVSVPFSALFIALADPLIVAFFQRGEFSSHEAHQTALALIAQGAGMWTVTTARQLVPVFYALGDTRTPVVVSVIDLLALIAIAYGLTPSMGHVGVSIAVSGSSFVQIACLWACLAYRLRFLDGATTARSVGKTVAASLVAGFGAWGAARILTTRLPAGWFARLVPGSIGVAVFVVLFLAVGWALRSEELAALAAGVRRKLGAKKPVS